MGAMQSCQRLSCATSQYKHKQTQTNSRTTMTNISQRVSAQGRELGHWLIVGGVAHRNVVAWHRSVLLGSIGAIYKYELVAHQAVQFDW